MREEAEDSGVATPAVRRSLRNAYWLGYAVYDVVGTLLALAALPVLPFLFFTRSRRGLGERLGRLPRAVRQLHRPVWVHAASVGEVLAAEPLIQQLRSHLPGLPVVVSTTSLTGRETARTRLAVDAVMLLPVDVGWIVDRVMRRLQPRGLIVVETELWPALFRAAARHRVPAAIVSGRISARAATRYAWIRWLTRAALAHVNVFAMQTDADAARVTALGAPAARVHVIGSLKFARHGGTGTDTARMPHSSTAALVDGRRVLIAASTHPGEEQLVVEVCTRLWQQHPDILLLIAPRRPERFDDVDRWLADNGVRHERRSRVHAAVAARTQVLLLDTIGELLDVLPAAEAVFVGGTIAPVGGHNVLEPAQFGKPVAFGPHTANVSAAAQALLESGAATRVGDAEQLYQEWQRLVTQPDAARAMGSRGQAVVTAGAAVAARTFAMIRHSLTEE